QVSRDEDDGSSDSDDSETPSYRESADYEGTVESEATEAAAEGYRSSDYGSSSGESSPKSSPDGPIAFILFVIATALVLGVISERDRAPEGRSQVLPIQPGEVAPQATPQQQQPGRVRRNNPKPPRVKDDASVTVNSLT